MEIPSLSEAREHFDAWLMDDTDDDNDDNLNIMKRGLGLTVGR